MDALTMNLQVLEASSISSRFRYISKQPVHVYGYQLLIHSIIANFLYFLLSCVDTFFYPLLLSLL